MLFLWYLYIVNAAILTTILDILELCLNDHHALFYFAKIEIFYLPF